MWPTGFDLSWEESLPYSVNYKKSGKTPAGCFRGALPEQRLHPLQG